MAEIVGEIKCPLCGDEVPLKKDVKKKFYYVCQCGQHMLRGPAGADTALSKGRIFGAESTRNVNVTEKPPVKQAEKPVMKPSQPARRKGPPPPPAPAPKPEPVEDVPPPVEEQKSGMAKFLGG